MRSPGGTWSQVRPSILLLGRSGLKSGESVPQVPGASFPRRQRRSGQCPWERRRLAGLLTYFFFRSVGRAPAYALAIQSGTVTPQPEPDTSRGSDLPASEPLPTWDVFLSHGGPDKPWVQTLADELAALGLQPFLDIREIEPADSFPGVLSRGLAGSCFLVLILSPRSSRPWVDLEWQSFIAHHGPLGRVLPVLLEPTEIPALLASIQSIDATDRDAARVAREIAHIAGRPGQLKEGDVRRLVLGQDLVFNLSWEGEDLHLIDPLGRTRTVTPPWRVDNQFWRAQHFFDRLSREPVTTDADRADLVGRATTLGSLLFDLLFDE